MSKEPGTEKQEKKPEVSHAPKESAPSKSAKGHTALPGGCLCWGCKAQGTRFNFCEEHYDHFKFGLIKKTGEPVPDYERKFEHFQAHKAKKSAHRVA
jgi:hypothetical protein